MNENAGFSTRSALLSGIAFGAIWYVGAQTILASSALPLTSLPISGALFLAASIPAFLLRQGRAKEDQFTAFDFLDDPVWVIQRTNGRVCYENSAALQCIGRTGDALIGRSVWDIWPTENCGDLRGMPSESKSLDPKPIQMEGRHFLAVAKDIDDGERVMLMYRDVSTDVAQRKMAEECMATVSHELRSPLTSIKGSMGLLLSNASGDMSASARKLLSVAHRNADRMSHILNDILETQKIAEGRMAIDPRVFDLAALLRDVIDTSALIFQRFDLTIDLVGADAPVWLNSDAHRIMQVLDNLLTNAAKFSRTGGTITVSLKTSAGGVILCVQDYGIGIPQNDQNKVFERFADMTNSNRGRNGGSGLGLSICKGIVDTLGGRIEFESREGAGTVFQVSLPRQIGTSITLRATENMQNAG
ncbi:PAS domain-containing sensor histidine kinase [uncultured Sulfitobacter sp.]|uniref:PAS domain-containing sensor histidine kinase n=1 Tax=uncultured Sulfitobacter sp. TaxID=191468 RepID=UPI00261FF5CA|nr:PAS domain-containing sensor histidine kinase [uncultured Sulfitobacter sp.]